jgi:hypothetical protein
MWEKRNTFLRSRSGNTKHIEEMLETYVKWKQSIYSSAIEIAISLRTKTFAILYLIEKYYDHSSTSFKAADQIYHMHCPGWVSMQRTQKNNSLRISAKRYVRGIKDWELHICRDDSKLQGHTDSNWATIQKIENRLMDI